MAGPSRANPHGGWKWAAAKSTGTSHVKGNTPCQDNFVCRYFRGNFPALIVAVSDGAGSASQSRLGSFLTCRGFEDRARKFLAAKKRLPDAFEVERWVTSIRRSIEKAAEKRGEPFREFAATLVGAIVAADEAIFIHIGDGAVACRQLDTWSVPSWPAHGEYASTTFFITDQVPQVRVTKVAGRVNAIAAFTDGIERLVLDFSSSQPHQPFFERMIAPLVTPGSFGRQSLLSRQLKDYLSQDAVNARTDDDKTLILAAR